MSHNDVNGEIFISPNNRMTAKYTLYAVDDSDVLTEITAMLPRVSDRATEISIRVLDENIKETEIDVKYRGNSDVYVEIQPVGHDNIPTEINVRPHNRMWGLYEVQEPPKITDILNPIQDSFTREKPQYQSINYGGNNSLTVGRTGDEIYRSFIQFNFGSWNPAFVIIESKLRLYYSGLVPQGSKIELFTVSEQWQEYGITHLNRPSPVSLIVDDYTNNVSEQYVEFEFTGIIVDWIKQHTPNYGFLVRLANESVDSIVTFRARESTRPPELLITYYDARIYSAGRSQVPVEIFVWNVGNKDVVTEIEVGSVIDDSDVLTQIYVHRYEVPVESELDVEITVTKPTVHAELTVSINDESDVLTEISARSEITPNTRDAEITVSKPVLESEIYVKYLNTLSAEITVRRHEDSSRLVEIAVSREYIDAELYVKHVNSIDTEITIQKTPDSDRNTEIAVSRPDIWTEITPRVPDDNNRDTEIHVRAVDDSSAPAEITVSRDIVYVEITVVEVSDVDAEIYVKHTDDVFTEITVKVFDDVLTEIDVIRSSKLPVEIAVSRPDALTVITVPYWDDSDVLTEIEPRILQASDVLTEIVVRSKGGAYAFII